MTTFPDKSRIQSRSDRTPDPRVSDKLRKLAEEVEAIKDV